MPANINKTSDQSHKHAKAFMQQIVDYNPSTLVYGSDHCCSKFNGISAYEALNNVGATTVSYTHLTLPTKA